MYQARGRGIMEPLSRHGRIKIYTLGVVGMTNGQSVPTSRCAVTCFGAWNWVSL